MKRQFITGRQPSQQITHTSETVPRSELVYTSAIGASAIGASAICTEKLFVCTRNLKLCEDSRQLHSPVMIIHSLILPRYLAIFSL